MSPGRTTESIARLKAPVRTGRRSSSGVPRTPRTSGPAGSWSAFARQHRSPWVAGVLRWPFCVGPGGREAGLAGVAPGISSAVPRSDVRRLGGVSCCHPLLRCHPLPPADISRDTGQDPPRRSSTGSSPEDLWLPTAPSAGPERSRPSLGTEKSTFCRPAPGPDPAGVITGLTALGRMGAHGEPGVLATGLRVICLIRAG